MEETQQPPSGQEPVSGPLVTVIIASFRRAAMLRRIDQALFDAVAAQAQADQGITSGMQSILGGYLDRNTQKPAQQTPGVAAAWRALSAKRLLRTSKLSNIHESSLYDAYLAGWLVFDQ